MCCCGISSFVTRFLGSLVAVLEKLTSICAMTAIIVCIVSTVTISIGLGIGLGYNYCFVAQRVIGEDYVENTDQSKPPTPIPKTPAASGRRLADIFPPFVTRFVSTVSSTATETNIHNVEDSMAYDAADSRESTDSLLRVRKDISLYHVDLIQKGQRIPSTGFYRMSIPLHGDFDFLALISQLRRRNENVTLDLIT